jgi:hypothetical protein
VVDPVSKIPRYFLSRAGNKLLDDRDARGVRLDIFCNLHRGMYRRKPAQDARSAADQYRAPPVLLPESI